MKYEIVCTYCGNNQIYKPKGKITKDSHTKCKSCKKDFYVKVQEVEEIINVKTSQITKNQKEKLSINSPILNINKKTLEPLIAQAINNNPSIQMLKLAVDFCKINDNEEEIPEIDLTKFLKVCEEKLLTE